MRGECGDTTARQWGLISRGTATLVPSPRCSCFIIDEHPSPPTYSSLLEMSPFFRAFARAARQPRIFSSFFSNKSDRDENCIPAAYPLHHYRFIRLEPISSVSYRPTRVGSSPIGCGSDFGANRRTPTRLVVQRETIAIDFFYEARM